MTQEVVSLNQLDRFVSSKMKLYLRKIFWWLPFVTYPDPVEWAVRKFVDNAKKQVSHDQPLSHKKFEDLQTLISHHKTSSFKTKILAWLSRCSPNIPLSITHEKPTEIDPVNHQVITQLTTLMTRYASAGKTADVNAVLSEELVLLEGFAAENQQTKNKLYPIIEEFLANEIEANMQILSNIRDWATGRQKHHIHDRTTYWWRHLENIRVQCINILRKESPNADKISEMIERLNNEIKTYTETLPKDEVPLFSSRLKQLELLYKIDEIPWFQTHELIEEDTHHKQIQADEKRFEEHRESILGECLTQSANCQILEGTVGSSDPRHNLATKMPLVPQSIFSSSTPQTQIITSATVDSANT